MALAHSGLIDRLWDATVWRWIRRDLRVVMSKLPTTISAGEPLVLVANHVSWYDGFLLRDIRRALGRSSAPHYSVMLRRELRQHPILGGIGAVGVEPGDPASLRALLRRFEAERTTEPGLTISFFPQGRIWPTTRRPLGFQRGIEGIVRAVAPAVVLPVGIHIEPLNARRPVAFINVGTPLRVAAEGDAKGLANELACSVAALLDEIHRGLHEHGESASDNLFSKTQLH